MGGHTRLVAAPPARQVATDGSVRCGRAASAYLSDTGGWHIHVTTPAARRRPYTVDHAELRALDRAEKHHPHPVELLTDSRTCQALLTRWIAGDLTPAPGDHTNEFRNLAQRIGARDQPVTVTWIPGHAGHPLNEGADALARLGSRRARDQLDKHELRHRADGIADAFSADARATTC